MLNLFDLLNAHLARNRAKLEARPYRPDPLFPYLVGPAVPVTLAMCEGGGSIVTAIAFGACVLLGAVVYAGGAEAGDPLSVRLRRSIASALIGAGGVAAVAAFAARERS